MLKSLICSALVCLALSQAGAQTLTMPPEIQKAFDNGTRSMSGKPGKITGKITAVTILL